MNVWGFYEGVEDKNVDDDEEVDINIEFWGSVKCLNFNMCWLMYIRC